jgi:Tol biopolymer transport system component
MSADGREPRQLTSMPGVEDRGFWSPDGTRIVFQSGGDLWLVDADGGEPERLTHFPGSEGNPAWSPDGRLIAFASDRGGNPDLWELVVEEGEHLRHPRE